MNMSAGDICIVTVEDEFHPQIGSNGSISKTARTCFLSLLFQSEGKTVELATHDK